MSSDSFDQENDETDLEEQEIENEQSYDIIDNSSLPVWSSDDIMRIVQSSDESEDE